MCLGRYLRYIIFCFLALTANARAYTFNITITGDQFPIVSGSTDVADGTILLVNFKKPRLPDAEQRLAAGLAACDPNCFPAIGTDSQFGHLVTVRNGNFKTGSFSFAGKAFEPNTYIIEITLSVDLNKKPSLEEIRSIGTLLGRSEVRIGKLEALSPSIDTQSSSEFYRNRYFLSGFLIRAGYVCDNKSKQRLTLGLDLIAKNEFRRLSKSYPEKTKEWMENGAEHFNSGVMKDGLQDTCTYALSMYKKAADILDADK